VEEVPVQDAAERPSLAKKDDAVPAGTARPEIRAKGLDAPQRPDRLHFSAPTVDAEGGIVEGDFQSAEGPTRSTSDGMTRAERRKAQKGTSGGRRRKK
ncbi:preprotein translocase subunit SecA, partial [Streptomyces sp. NPDC056730]